MTVSLPDRPSWHALAECAGVDPDLFHPTNGDYRQAARVCETCPVKAECLQWALDHDEPHGMWGGLGPRARQRLRGDAPRRLSPIAHGTEAGHKAHNRRGIPPCRACRDAHRARQLAPTPANPPLVAVESGDPRTVTHGGPGTIEQATG